MRHDERRWIEPAAGGNRDMLDLSAAFSLSSGKSERAAAVLSSPDFFVD